MSDALSITEIRAMAFVDREKQTFSRYAGIPRRNRPVSDDGEGYEAEAEYPLSLSLAGVSK